MPSVNELLIGAAQGDEEAGATLLSTVYEELRRLAAIYLRRERSDHTLQPTALVNEACLRLMDDTALASGDRERFMAIAARAMRNVLVDYARRRKAAKRGGGDDWQRVTLDEVIAPNDTRHIDVLVLNELLERLTEMDDRVGQVVELRFFGGLSISETARVLNVSQRTVDNDWYVARAWLARELADRDVS